MLILFMAAIMTIGGADLQPSEQHSQQAPTHDNFVNITWLGNFSPSDYSTKVFRIFGEDGIIITNDTILGSTDGGKVWKIYAKAKYPSQVIYDAWPVSSSLLYVLSDNTWFVNSNPGSARKHIFSEHGQESYLSITGDEKSGRIVIAGGRRVSISRDKMDDVPKYARDPTSDTPSMIIPVISISDDSGRTWQSIQLPKSIGYLYGVKMSGTYGVAWGPYAVYTTTNTGLSWKLMEETYPVSASIAGDRLVVSLKDGRILEGSIKDPVLSSVAHLSNPLGLLTFVNSCTGFGVSSEKSPKSGREIDALMKTEDGGRTWTPVLHAKKIVALSVEGTCLYGVSYDRVFRIDLSTNQSTLSCGATGGPPLN